MNPDSERLLRAGAARFLAALPMRAFRTYLLAAVLVTGGSVALGVTDAGSRHFNGVALALTVGLFLICDRLEIPVASIWTSPTQLAFVPMVVLLPPGWVPFVVVGCSVAPLFLPGVDPRFTVSRLVTRIGDAAYALGPALVLLAAGISHFAWSHWPIYLAALASQFLLDIAFGSARLWFAERTSLAANPELGWLYLTDVCLSFIGLLVAAAASMTGPGLVLMALPVVILLAVFARERKQRVEQSLELSTAYRGTAELLGDVIEDDDAYTGIHSKQVVDLSVAVADRLGVNASTRRMVEYGALLHDVGKLRVPNVIIRKQGKLDDEEWEVMREHTVAGEEMLSLVGGTLAEVGRVVRHTHERYDGAGYPDGLVGKDIPIESRIIAACDAWNAMTTSRSYRRALSVEVAADEMKRCAGTHFDPVVVAAVLEEVAGPPYTSQAATPDSSLPTF